MRTIQTFLIAALLVGRADAATILVTQSSGASLQDAIDAAAPGDKILVDGAFAEAIVIDKPLTLRGARGVGNVVPGCGEVAGIDVQADGVRIERMVVFGGTTTNIRIVGRDDVLLRQVFLEANAFAGGCPAPSQRGVDLVNSTNVLLKAVEASGSLGEDPFGEAFIRIAEIPVDGGVKVTRCFQNYPSPVGILVEASDDTAGVPWRGRVGVRLLGNRIVSAETGIELRDSTGVVVQANHVGGAPGPSGVGIHLDSDSTGNLVRRNRLGNNPIDLEIDGAGNCVERNLIDGVPQPGAPCS